MTAIPRDRNIARHVDLAVRQTTLTRDAFADTVVRIYHERTPAHLRHIEFHVLARGGDPYAVLRANAQLVFRMVDGLVRMPCELEEALVLALPEPYRAACVAELAERYGLLAAALPAPDAAGCQRQHTSLAREFADAMDATARCFEDGRLDVSDAEHAAVAVVQLQELIACATTLLHKHEAVLREARSGPRLVERART